MVTRLSSKRCNRLVVLLLDDEMFFSLLFEVVFTKVKRVQTTDVRFEVVRSARCVDLFFSMMLQKAQSHVTTQNLKKLK